MATTDTSPTGDAANPTATQADPAATQADPAATTETAAPAPAPAPAAATTEPAAEPAATGNDWAALRSKYAKEDPKLLKRLERYSSTEAALDALIAAQNKIASGELKAPLPKDPTPEQLAAWREENGIPASPADYKIELPDGFALGEADKPVVDEFLKLAHERNMRPEDVSAAVAFDLERRDREIAQRRELDENARVENDEVLREEWGSEYKLNKNLISGLLDLAPNGVKEQILNGRLSDGTPIGSHAPTLRWLANLAREVNPVATVVPGSGTNAAQAIESELASITALMGDKTSAYWKGPTADKMQARYRELVTVQSKLK